MFDVNEMILHLKYFARDSSQLLHQQDCLGQHPHLPKLVSFI